jgi:hypothetical protein
MENEICPHCAERGVFGYRDKQTDALTWFCTAHRLGKYYADARRDIPAQAVFTHPQPTP